MCVPWSNFLHCLSWCRSIPSLYHQLSVPWCNLPRGPACCPSAAFRRRPVFHLLGRPDMENWGVLEFVRAILRLTENSLALWNELISERPRCFAKCWFLSWLLLFIQRQIHIHTNKYTDTKCAKKTQTCCWYWCVVSLAGFSFLRVCGSEVAVATTTVVGKCPGQP